MGGNLDDVIATLDVEPAYVNFPELYDIVYHRFQQSTGFIDLITKAIKRNESVLDLAAGTGDVSQQLLNKGYKNIALADKNEGMLRIARNKIGDITAYVTPIATINLRQTFDAIVVRQAINYLMDYEGLVSGLKTINQHLNPGGRLIFNAPNYSGDDYGDKFSEYEAQGFHVKVREMNLVEGSTITHTQNCLLIRKDGLEIKKVYDINRFGLFKKEEFENALHDAGFASAHFYGKGLEEFTPASKTIYCIAAK